MLAICEQQQGLPACASAQSNLSRCCSMQTAFLYSYCYTLNVKTSCARLPGGRLHVSCVPMHEQKNDEKGYFFRAGQCATLSPFRVGKMLFL